MADDTGTTNDAGDTDTGDKGTTDKTFSQAEVDRIVQERVARVKTAPPDDYNDLKTKAAEFDKLQESQKSELEKATARAEKAETDRQKALDTANARLIQAEVLAAATAQKALKPEHMHKLIDTGQVTVGDDGQVTGASEAVKAFLDANPEYVGTTRATGDADQGARNKGAEQLSRDALQTMSADEIDTALREGRLNSVIGAR